MNRPPCRRSARCVEQHGSEITVDSVVGQATTFTVHLPLIREGVEVVEA